MFIMDPDLVFLPYQFSGSRIPDPGVKKAPDPGSGTLVIILNQCCGSGMFIPDPDFFSILDTDTYLSTPMNNNPSSV
jgi:hypothetical protein